MNAPVVPSRALAGSTLVEPVLAVAGLRKSFSDREILQGLDFTLSPGQSTALIGANGSGKSTLLRCLVRLVEPTSGRIAMLGQDVVSLRPRDLRRFRAQVGIVWQRHNLVPRLSALSNVIHGVQARMSGPRAWFQSLAPAEVRAEAMACLDRVGLADRASARVDSISGGQQQRVAIARMLMQRPAFILADEPDASLDPQTGQEVMELLLGLVRQDGLSLLVISHRLEHTLAYSDRILGLANGRIALDLPTVQANAAALRRFFDHEGAA
ncbi:phosphonate ABC transporter ATP-binding protein [Pseudotabrizicola algicola]|uniref:ATP-binding cassette domain-containing protein n=1 Tax=Pseudotabrizicola algicola TaxID=2709381 RepID=A0A6B3RRK5_9RHOB|nr:ATP-binding cassette domain-containing protein [Pseudotabrizicola algicola]NEX48780.1 ATP-binding cassette domain-containing protein [Pseudotabrizicola algicola]